MAKRNRKDDAPITIEEVEAVQMVQAAGADESEVSPWADETDEEVAAYLSEGSEDVSPTVFQEDEPRVSSVDEHPRTVQGLLDFADQVIMTGATPEQIVSAIRAKFQVASDGPSAKAGKVKAIVKFTLVRRDYTEVKMANQAKAILQVLNDHGGSLSYEELVENLPAYVHTVQKPERLVAFYRNALVKDGYVEVQ